MIPFVAQVESAYEHIYDVVYLITHPLTELLVPDSTLSRKERAWRLHHILLDAIEELAPVQRAPAFSNEWRRHRLMVLRYVDCLEPQAVADQIGIGRRHYYREQEKAIEAVARIIRSTYVEQTMPGEQAGSMSLTQGRDEQPLSQLELHLLKAASLAQPGRHAALGNVVAALLPLLQEKLTQHRLIVDLGALDTLPRIAIERNLLRQILLGLFGYLIERADGATLSLTAQMEEESVHLSLTVRPLDAIQSSVENKVEEQTAALAELAALAGIHLSPVLTGKTIVGFEARLRCGLQRSVLVVDDNEDVLEIFRRCLSPQGYEVIFARTAKEALDLAARLQPQAITVDLMMPEQDGWDLLHQLLGQATTRDIPIIICSVLPQRELALSLGATAFLRKPFTEEMLLTMLNALDPS